jgi:elongation factor P
MGLNITDLKKGTIFQYEDVPYRVVEYSQKVVGRGGSIVNVRIKSLVDGKVLDRTFKGSDQLGSADVRSSNAQFLYADDSLLYFMDTGDYSQFSLTKEDMSDQFSFLKEGDLVVAQSFNGQIINIELPKNVLLEVTYTEYAVKGDTSSSITKDATLETGLEIRVPAFIKRGDLIRVDTRTGQYIERSK